MPSILVTGGSGYLGQFLVQALSRDPGNHVAFTFHTRAPSDAELAALGSPEAVKVDLTSGLGLDQCLVDGARLPDVVLNCAAMSVPRECETDPKAARAINVPGALLAWLNRHAQGQEPDPPRTLLIHLSTDQVYDGSKAFWKESDAAKPVNTYGRTKVLAEEAITAQWQHYAILRSSIIVGPPAPAIALPKTPPLVWMDTALKSGQPSTFFVDEWRCPVFVHDLVAACRSLIAKAHTGKPIQLLLNAGGPDRLSRAGMAEVLAQVRGYARATAADVAQGAVQHGEGSAELPPLSALITRVPAASAGNRGVNSPQDISMDTSLIVKELEVVLTPFADAVLKSL